MAPLGATFLKQRNAQKKTIEPSEGTAKGQRVEPSHEDLSIDPIAVVDDVGDDDDDDDVTVAVVVAAGPSRASPSLCSMLERVLET